MQSANDLLSSHYATLSDVIAAHGRERPDRAAFVHDGQALSYRELNSLIDQIAAGLQRQGVRPGQVVAILAATTNQSAAAFLGALRAGAVPAPLAPSSTAEQVAAMITDAAARCVFADSSTVDLLPKASPDIIDLDALEDWLPPKDLTPLTVDVTADMPFNIIYSSGTTGVPKGIVHTHGVRWTQGLAWRDVQFENAVTLVSTPIYSNTTLTTLLPTLQFGGTAVLLGKFDAHRFLEVAERERVTHAMLVPVQYQRIMALPDFDDFDLSSFAMKVSTSAPFAAQLKADVVQRWPGMLLEIYGMTEGGGSCLLFANNHPDKLHTVGRPGLGNDIRLIDDDGVEVRTGEIGEVVGRSAFMMKGYHNRQDVTDQAAWFDEEGRRFIRHGDIGRFDNDGFLTLLGRSKDMIISGGFNIYPPDLEAVLMQHPAIREAAVIGIPSSQWGETPYAFYVPADDAPVAAEIVAWANARLGKTQRLAGAEPIDELPRSAIGKVLKRELRDLVKS